MLLINFPDARIVDTTLKEVISVIDWETSKLCKTIIQYNYGCRS